MIPFFLFIFGLIIGSFLNAVIYRLKSGDSFVMERSLCPRCRKTLGFWDLIPLLSFIFLKAKCRYCKKPISWQYPLVELFTGIIFIIGYFNLAGKALDFSSWIVVLRLISFYIFSGFLIIIFVYDLKHYLILDKVTLPASAIAFLLNVLLGYSLVNLLLAAGLIFGFFLFQFLISKGQWIGGGDLRLGFLMGAMLGWPKAVLALFLAYISGAIIGCLLIIFKKKKFNSQLPFGTFLTAATLVALLFGEEILNWYLNGAGLW